MSRVQGWETRLIAGSGKARQRLARSKERGRAARAGWYLIS